MTSSSLKYLLKLGSGKRGSIKGLVYASEAVSPGWVVCVDGVLLQKKVTSEGDVFCSQIDSDTLKVRRWLYGEFALDVYDLSVP